MLNIDDKYVNLNVRDQFQTIIDLRKLYIFSNQLLWELINMKHK